MPSVNINSHTTAHTKSDMDICLFAPFYFTWKSYMGERMKEKEEKEKEKKKGLSKQENDKYPRQVDPRNASN